MSGLTIRSYVKMAFDNGSYQTTQRDYNAALANLQKSGLSTLKKTNKDLQAEHDKLSRALDEDNKQALEDQKRRIKENAAALQKEATRNQARIPGDHRVSPRTGKVYGFAKDAEEYKRALTKMKGANNDYKAHMARIGVEIKTDALGNLDFEHFSTLDRGDRELALEHSKNRLTGATSARDLERRKHLHNQITAAVSTQGKIEGATARKVNANEKVRRLSLSALKNALRENNQMYREQLQIQMQINQTLTRMKVHLQQGLVNALMASAIALMSFGFKLQGVVNTFQEFEKELMNAQSIFQTTNEVLFSLSDEIVNFGTQYGISLGTASEGLYTLASAGLSAADSQEVLANTLKLSMAVQGDHDTIAKLTTQTIFGFGLQMSDSAALTDKFAHAINMSLIEYQDLASAVKFAMPFFVSTGQNIDQLLGSLQVLTNRALEAGIAGRGLRQALAEFAQHAQDSEAAFRKLGVEIMDSEGNFKMLTDIAMQFKEAMGPAASDVDLMTTLLEDLNVRGATAFVHLVQNAEEFEGAVNDLQNSAGAATRMADIQQKSLANQIQVVKNALMAPFLLSTELGKANGTMNEFGQTLHDIVQNFESFFVHTLDDGTRVLTEQGAVIRDLTINTLKELGALLEQLLDTFASITKEGEAFGMAIHALLIPIKILVGFIGLLGEGTLEALIMFKAFNSLLPVMEMNTYALQMATMDLIMAERNLGHSMAFATAMSMAAQASLMIGFLALQHGEPVVRALGVAFIALAGAIMAVNLAMSLKGGPLETGAFIAAAVAGAATIGVITAGMYSLMKPPSYDNYDMGGRIYDSGGALGSRHFPVMVEPGETIVSKTQNMLGGGGITLNIQGDIVTNDADDFAERIAVALPDALRKHNDIGGI